MSNKILLLFKRFIFVVLICTFLIVISSYIPSSFQVYSNKVTHTSMNETLPSSNMVKVSPETLNSPLSNSTLTTLSTATESRTISSTQLTATKPKVTQAPPNAACYASQTPFIVNLNYSDIDFLEENVDFIEHLLEGGSWRPAQAVSTINISIIIPYRKRESHLAVFLLNVHKFLQMQNISYTIFIVNQVDDKKFNRAGLFNVGFYEAQKMNSSHDCYFFHDVDLIPDNGNLTYCCSSDAVLHYATAIWRHSAPGEIKDYSMFFGGIVAATASQFQKANGFSNRYWGWGGEDDDFLKRVRASGQNASNIPFADGRYVMFKHDRDKGNEPNGLRMKLLGETQKTWKSDGLNTLNYTVLSILKKKYYTEIQVSF